MRTAQEFKAFFEVIPADRWTTGTTGHHGGRCCALGHLDSFNYRPASPSAQAFAKILREHFPDAPFAKHFDDDCEWIYRLNDGRYGAKPRRDDEPYDPKANVIATLNSIIAKQEGKV